jgi:hypothetical protein
MQPITPTQFIELLEKSDHDFIKLWHERAMDYVKCYYPRRKNTLWCAMTSWDNDNTLLTELYESKPRTAYDDFIIWRKYEEYEDLVIRYKSELESIPSKIDNP